MDRYVLYSRLLMYAQKNVAFVGAPGVGKTRLAITATSNAHSPIVVTGKEDMSFDDLIARYVVENGKPKIVLGELSRAIVSSWIGLTIGEEPTHIVFDEINRCNTDTLLGEVFTALDIEHRMSVPIIRGTSFMYIKYLIKNPEEFEEQFSLLCESLGVGVDELRDSLEKVVTSAKQKGLNGIPLPYSFRIAATMNILDRAQLYKLGYALQRRFGFIYVISPIEEYRPEFNIDKISYEKYSESIYKAMSDPNSRIVKQAIRELTIDQRIPSLVDSDYPTMIKLIRTCKEANELYSNASKVYDDVSRLVAYLYSVANSLNIELGISILVDIAKLYIVSTALAMKNQVVLNLEEMADLAASALVLPQLSAVLPRIRAEAILFGESSKSLRVFTHIYDILKELYGPYSMAMRMLGGLSLELPSMYSS
mgnify:CR=1 FL=1